MPPLNVPRVAVAAIADGAFVQDAGVACLEVLRGAELVNLITADCHTVDCVRPNVCVSRRTAWPLVSCCLLKRKEEDTMQQQYQ